MNSPRRFNRTLLFLIALIIVAIPIHWSVKNMQWYKTRELIRPGVLAPTFQLCDESGRLFNLYAYLGKPIMLCFCKLDRHSCAAQARDLNGFAEQWAHQGLQIAYIAEEGSVEKMRELDQKVDADFYILRDHGGRVTKTYGAGIFPSIVFIDKTGIVAYSVEGRLKSQSGKTRKLINALVQEEL